MIKDLYENMEFVILRLDKIETTEIKEK